MAPSNPPNRGQASGLSPQEALRRVQGASHESPDTYDPFAYVQEPTHAETTASTESSEAPVYYVDNVSRYVSQPQPSTVRIAEQAQPTRSSQIRQGIRKHRVAAAGAVVLVSGLGVVQFTGLPSVPDAVAAPFQADNESDAPIKEHIALPAHDCLDPESGFTATVKAVGQLIHKVTIIDSADPAKANEVQKARQKAFADPAYTPPKELTVTGLFDETPADITSVYARPMPTEHFYQPSNADTTPTYVNRIPVGEYSGKLTLGWCIKEGVEPETAIEQISPKRIVVRDSDFLLNPLQDGKMFLDYEVSLPQGNPDTKESLRTAKEIQRIFKVLAPDGKHDAKKNTFDAGASRNQAILDALKYMGLSGISTEQNGIVLLEDFRESVDEYIRDVAGENVVIEHVGTPTSPAETFAKKTGLNVTNDIPNIKFINPVVTYEVSNEGQTNE